MTEKITASIVVITHNNLEYARLCLDSIYEKTQHPSFELILVDIASEDGTPAYLKTVSQEHHNVRLILNDEDRGLAHGYNLGAQAARGEHLVFLRSDTVVTETWLSGLIKHLHDPGVGMVGPVSNSSLKETSIEVSYETLAEMEIFAKEFISDHLGQALEVDVLPLRCVVLRKSVFEAVGPLDERFKVGMFEEDDFSLRLQADGYRLICAEDVYVHHWASASFSDLDFDEYQVQFLKNLDAFIEKWQTQAYRPELRRRQINRLLDKVPRMGGELPVKNLWAASLQKENLQLKAQLEKRNQQISDYYKKIQEIESSFGWKFINFTKPDRWESFLQRRVPESSSSFPSRINRLFKRRGIKGILQISLERSGLFTLVRTAKRQFSRGLKRILGKQIRKLPEGRELKGNLNRVQGTILSDRHPWPLVSVILPVYNQADWLFSSAKSVLANQYPRLELIILDDGSTDDVDDVLVELVKDTRVRVYRQPNQKLPRALTHAHQFAEGDFITWTSADNLYETNAIKALVDGLLENPEAIMVYGDVRVIDDDGFLLADKSYRPQNLDPNDPTIIRLYRDAQPLGLEADNFINACFMYRAEASSVLEGTFGTDMIGVEDYDFWLRLQKFGPFHHLENEMPLYRYRVHKRSMSHDLLTRELHPHLKRLEALIQYEKARKEYSNQRWTLVLSSRLSESEREKIRRTANSLPVNILDGEAGWGPDRKQILFLPENVEADEQIYVNSLVHFWRITWVSKTSGSLKTRAFWKGWEFSQLALKSRYYVPNDNEFPNARNRTVIGCHMPLGTFSLDLRSLDRIIASNRDFYFVMLDVPGNCDPDVAYQINFRHENAIYAGEREIGSAYQTYACFDLLWVPPLVGDAEAVYRMELALAYAVGKPCLIPDHIAPVPAPYQYLYNPVADDFGFVTEIKDSSLDFHLANRYLAKWETTKCLEYLLSYANTITQEITLERPSFKSAAAQTTKPTRWPSEPPGYQTKVGLVIDHLNKGGLENIVALLARKLPAWGCDPFVICTKKGGLVAKNLRREGVRIYVTNDDPSLMMEVLLKENPDLINTQFAQLPFLKLASETGIPIIETIQNTYVWFSEDDWTLEKERSTCFSHAIAVSRLVKSYYLQRNDQFPDEKVLIIPNAVDLNRLEIIPRDLARKELSLDQEDIFFVNLASYDFRKNQIGLITAFNQVAREHPEVRLLCAGNILDPSYFSRVRNHRDGMPTKDRIQLEEFRTDVGVLLAAADAFVLPSFFEGWSVSGTEALLTGTPVVHTDCGSAHELVGDDQARGVIVPNPGGDPLKMDRAALDSLMRQAETNNHQALADSLRDIVINIDDWRRKREQISAYARSEFSSEKMVERYVDNFRKLL